MDYTVVFFFFQAEGGIRDLVRARGLGDVYKRQAPDGVDGLRAPLPARVRVPPLGLELLDQRAVARQFLGILADAPLLAFGARQARRQQEKYDQPDGKRKTAIPRDTRRTWPLPHNASRTQKPPAALRSVEGTVRVDYSTAAKGNTRADMDIIVG